MGVIAKLKKKRLDKRWKKSYGEYQSARDEYQTFMKNNKNQGSEAQTVAKKLKEKSLRLYRESNVLQSQRSD